MSSTLDVTRKRNAPIEQRQRNKITITQKRWLLSAHLFFTTAWIGGGLCSLAFDITSLRTTDPHLLHSIYVLAAILDTTVIRGGAAGTLITGILMALLTQWGLVRFYWIMTKEIIAVLTVIVDLIIIRWNDQVISWTATQGFQAFSSPLYLTNRTLLFVGILLQLIFLGGVIVISIFKPWGQRKRSSQSRA